MAKTFEEATQKLGSLIVSGRAGQKSDTPAQVVESCEVLGVDLSKLRAVHIAGSKGKGSTSSFTERILRGAGLKTGLYTSPHLVDIRERFRIGGKVLSKEAFAAYFWKAHDVLISHHGELHFFHFLTVLGFYIFQEEKVDACVVEVGLGGRLDATNALPCPVVCAITLLDLDHQAILGNTIEEISREKAGIIKAGIPVVSIETQRPEAYNELRIKAAAVGAPIFTAAPLVLSGKDEGSLGLSGTFQYHNAALALSLARVFVARTPCVPPSLPPATTAWIAECEKHWGGAGVGRGGGAGPGGERGAGPTWAVAGLEEESLRSTRWPGRAQVLEGVCGGGRLMLDGAHTAESLRCCAEWFKSVTEAGAHARRVRVLVFNTTGSRTGTDLLKHLATLRTGAEGGGDKSMWDLALFAPNDSSLTSVDKVAGSKFDYSWQEELVKAWGAAGGGGGGGAGVPLRAADVEGKDVAEILGGGVCRIGGSIRDALECARMLDEKLGGGKVDVLLTGSLYLVGDALLCVCKDDLRSVLDL